MYQAGAVTDVFLNEDDVTDAFGDVASAASHYHELKLATGPAIPGAEA